MVDIIPHVAELLAPTGAQIELAWQDTLATFPLIVLSEPSNTGTTNGGAEVLTRIHIQVDSFTLSKKVTKDLAMSVDAILIPAGFTRVNGQQTREGDLERYMAIYSCTLDYTHENILI